MTIYVGIGELATSAETGVVIKTLALGSCVAVAVFSKRSPIAGLLHVQLPESNINKDLAAKRPAAFADTGIPLLLSELAILGCKPPDVVVKLAGGAQVMDPNNTFNIGKRNYLAIKKILWANRLFPAAEEIGGEISRSVTLVVGEKDLLIHTPGYENRKI
ncbi:MAG: chemotaxis protein CheD [Candidatus Riflebacteria bacterium]|nr:chemotaxis protein CheD [Candidatus Riflebacteria bacterium]